MNTIVAICGAQGVGKTTLSEALEQQHPNLFTSVKTHVSDIANDLGIDVKNPGTAEDRMRLQWALLYHFKQLITRHKVMTHPGSTVVLDRGFHDLIVYTLIDPLIQQSTDEAIQVDVKRYIDACMAETSTVDIVIMIQPGIPITEAQGKQSYLRTEVSQLVFNTLLRGTVGMPGDDSILMMFERSATELDYRINSVKDVVDRMNELVTPGLRKQTDARANITVQ